MIEAKVRLSFMVPGAIMLSSQECEENSKENYDCQKLTVKVKIPRKNKTYKEVLDIRTRKTRPAKQAMIICKEAYEYMISNDGKPEQADFKLTKAKWLNMSKKQRLDIHMKQIAEALGGFNPTYEILND